MNCIKGVFAEDEHHFFVGKGHVVAGILLVFIWLIALIMAVLMNHPVIWGYFIVISLGHAPLGVSFIVIGCFTVQFDGSLFTVTTPFINKSKTIDLKNYGYAYYISNPWDYQSVMISREQASTKEEIKKVNRKAKAICSVFRWLPRDEDETVVFNIGSLSKEQQKLFRANLEKSVKVVWREYDWGI